MKNFQLQGPFCVGLNVLAFFIYPLEENTLLDTLLDIYISLLIIPCIIYYVTNKETLNLEPWT